MASALVQMTPFSPCTQLTEMMMIAAEASLESFPGSREGTNKRSHSDGDEEQDRSHVKKRRKQSKPIRITANDSSSPSTGKENVTSNNRDVTELDFSETGEHFLTEGLGVVDSRFHPGSEEYEENQMRSPAKVDDDNHDTRPKQENLYDSTVPLNLSSMKNSFIDSLIIPNFCDGQKSTNKNVPIDSSSMNQFQSSENSKASIAQDNTYLSQSPSLMMPLFKQNQIHNPMSSQMRIFNPEAFCDLCNKEFCNKYFLKTHKANKHGIYSESPSGHSLLEPMPSLPFTNYFSTPSESYDNNAAYQATATTKSIILYQPNYSTASRTTPKRIQTPQPSQTGISGKSTSTSGANMRALCNICQREFCNKYFVRRHKLKIHGIIDPVNKDGTSLDSQENSLNSSQDKVDLTPNDLEAYGGYMKHFMNQSFGSDVKETNDVIKLSEPKIEKLKESEEKAPESEVPAPIVPLHFPAASSPLFQISQNEESSKENGVSSQKMKKLGVINSDAYCDICCKEYCNKYFLRTHKLKSHGILPVEEKKEELLNGSNCGLPWYQMQTTPLNLIVNETSGVNRENFDAMNFDPDGDECACNTCGRYFQSQFLLKMHEAYSHPNKLMINENPTPTKPIENNFDTTKNNSTDESEIQQKPTSESVLSVVKNEFPKDAEDLEKPKTVENNENIKKLQHLISRLNNPNSNDNSICDVCDKDVGHMSLLENHILKDHAVLLEELGNSTEEDNSSSQSSLTLISSYKKECPQCQKTFFKSSLYEQHIAEFHSNLELPGNAEIFKDATDLKDFNMSLKISPTQFTSYSSSDERQGLQTPTSSFCEICKKELCNKYFMKTHMQRMHGISIENGAHIGGVVCEICNKELCSKYFLRVHKQNSHGIVDEQFLPQLGFDFGRNQSPNSDPALKPTDQADLTHRYFTHFNEVCTICHRRFRSVKWLKAHLWNDHGEEGKEKWKEIYLQSNPELKTYPFEDNSKETPTFDRNMEFSPVFGSSTSQLNNFLKVQETQISKEDIKSSEKLGTPDKNLLNNTMFSMLINGKESETKQYQCSFCPFTTTILAFLFIHERSHSNSRSLQSEPEQPYQCPVCFQTVDTKESFEKHVKLHKLPWLQPYPLINSNEEVSNVVRIKPEMKSELNTSLDAADINRQDQEVTATRSVNDSKARHNFKTSQQDKTTDSTMQCTKCGLICNNVQQYLDHINKEHPYLQMDQDLPAYLQQMEKALSSLATNSGIPTAFAVPRAQDKVTMQPFVLEDSEYATEVNKSVDPKPGKTFLSSLVFLPVKEKLKKSVRASFKLTPT